MAIRVDRAALEQSCKEIIETILFSLPDAYKGTVYRIGRPPLLNAERITSGAIDVERKTISWGLPQNSDYNPPGRDWNQYRDEPGRPLEAMGWCVEMQKSWTSEDPKNDSRSGRNLSEGLQEDYHHMEPVLIRKKDVYFGSGEALEAARNYRGEILWQDSECMVVGVIKIHFQPNTIGIGSGQTKVIKRLSRSLGTELLSYQLRRQSAEAMHQLAEDRLHSCNILADSLRNVITKSGLIFSLIKLELASLRTQWERALLEYSDQKDLKAGTVAALNEILISLAEDEQVRELIDTHNRYLGISLPPERGENWVRMHIEEKWNKLISKRPLDPERTKNIRDLIDQLKSCLYLGKDPNTLARYNKLSESLKKGWTGLIYRNTDHLDLQYLDRLIRILENPSLNLHSQSRSRERLIRLKALAEVMGELEANTNELLRQVLNGHNNGVIPRRMNEKST